MFSFSRSLAIEPHSFEARFEKSAPGMGPVKFDIVHTEPDPDRPGHPVAPGTNTLLRDEVAELHMQVPASGGSARTFLLDVDTPSMKCQTLGTRGSVQMYDFGIQEDGEWMPLSLKKDGHGRWSNTALAGQYAIPFPSSGTLVLRMVMNREGMFKLRLRSADHTLTAASQWFTVRKRIRKYARVPENRNVDFNIHDGEFERAAKYWSEFYRHAVDPDALKAIGFQESTLGSGDDAVDIMTIGNAGDHVLDYFHRTAPYDTMKEAVPDPDGPNGFTIRNLHHPAANKESVRDAIHWGTCWLFQKAQKSRHVPSPGITPFGTEFSGWNTWEKAVSHYGPNTAYLEVVEGPWKRGRKDSTGMFLWPVLTNHRARK